MSEIFGIATYSSVLLSDGIHFKYAYLNMTLFDIRYVSVCNAHCCYMLLNHQPNKEMLIHVFLTYQHNNHSNF